MSVFKDIKESLEQAVNLTNKKLYCKECNKYFDEDETEIDIKEETRLINLYPGPYRQAKWVKAKYLCTYVVCPKGHNLHKITEIEEKCSEEEKN